MNSSLYFWVDAHPHTYRENNNVLPLFYSNGDFEENTENGVSLRGRTTWNLQSEKVEKTSFFLSQKTGRYGVLWSDH